MKLFKKFVYACMAIVATTGFTSCDDDNDIPTPALELNYKFTVCDQAIGYPINENGTFGTKFVVTEINEGDVWEFNNGEFSITKATGASEKGSYAIHGQQMTLTFANGVKTEGFTATRHGWQYYYPLDADGEEDTSKDPIYEQRYIGFGDVMYLTSGAQRYRITVPARVYVTEKLPYSGKIQTDW